MPTQPPPPPPLSDEEAAQLRAAWEHVFMGVHRYPNINCVFYGRERCGHPKAPPKLIGLPACVFCTGDVRIRSCTLQVQHARLAPPAPPPKVL